MTALPGHDELVVRLPRRPLTLDDVAELGGRDEFHRYELSDEGVLSIVPPADLEHSALVTQLVIWLASCYGARRVLTNPGVQLAGGSGGRIPDVVVLRRDPDGATVWADPSDVLLAVEVVSPASRTADRALKPGEYAAARIPHYWRVEREHGAATVHRSSLGTAADGRPAYVGPRADLLDDLLAAQPPAL